MLFVGVLVEAVRWFESLGTWLQLDILYGLLLINESDVLGSKIQSARKNNCPCATLRIVNLLWTILQLNLTLRGEKPATDRLSPDMVFYQGCKPYTARAH